MAGNRRDGAAGAGPSGGCGSARLRARRRRCTGPLSLLPGLLLLPEPPLLPRPLTSQSPAPVLPWPPKPCGGQPRDTRGRWVRAGALPELLQGTGDITAEQIRPARRSYRCTVTWRPVSAAAMGSTGIIPRGRGPGCLSGCCSCSRGPPCFPSPLVAPHPHLRGCTELPALGNEAELTLGFDPSTQDRARFTRLECPWGALPTLDGYKRDTHWDTAQLCSPIPCPAPLPAPSIGAGDGEQSHDTSPCRRPYFPVAFVILPTQSRACPAATATVTSTNAGGVRRGSCSPAPFCPPRAAAPAGREMGLRVRGFPQHRRLWAAGGGFFSTGPSPSLAPPAWPVWLGLGVHSGAGASGLPLGEEGGVMGGAGCMCVCV